MTTTETILLIIVIAQTIIMALGGYALWQSSPPNQQNAMIGAIISAINAAIIPISAQAMRSMENYAANTKTPLDDVAVKAAQAVIDSLTVSANVQPPTAPTPPPAE